MTITDADRLVKSNLEFVVVATDFEFLGNVALTGVNNYFIQTVDCQPELKRRWRD